jgi:serine/threonine protein kinase
MDSERWKRLLPLLDEALALSASERSVFVTEACGYDADLMAELVKLIEAARKAETADFFEELGAAVNPLYDKPRDPRLGKTIGHYTIEQMIGRGGMGKVYLANDRKLQRRVALKFLPDHLLRHEEGRRRFLNEARVAASLDHPNICTIFEIDDRPEGPFIAMAYVPGKSLKELLSNGPLDVLEALRLAMQICEGLEAVHSRRIIHRDINPANLMVNEQCRLIIMDFGLAKLPGAEDL